MTAFLLMTISVIVYAGLLPCQVQRERERKQQQQQQHQQQQQQVSKILSQLWTEILNKYNSVIIFFKPLNINISIYFF